MIRHVEINISTVIILVKSTLISIFSSLAHLLVKRQSRCSRRWCCCCGAGCSSVFGSADHESPSSLPLAPLNHWKIRLTSSSSCAVLMSRANTGSWSHGWSSETASLLDRSHDGRNNWNLILSQVLVMQ